MGEGRVGVSEEWRTKTYEIQAPMYVVSTCATMEYLRVVKQRESRANG